MDPYFLAIALDSLPVSPATEGWEANHCLNSIIDMISVIAVAMKKNNMVLDANFCSRMFLCSLISSPVMLSIVGLAVYCGLAAPPLSTEVSMNQRYCSRPALRFQFSVKTVDDTISVIAKKARTTVASTLIGPSELSSVNTPMRICTMKPTAAIGMLLMICSFIQAY